MSKRSRRQLVLIGLAALVGSVMVVAAHAVFPHGPQSSAAAEVADAEAKDANQELRENLAARDLTVFPSSLIDYMHTSTSAQDWVTYADHVVVVRIDEERMSSPTETEVKRGEGMVLRSVDATVESVVWSSPETIAPAPATLNGIHSGGAFYQAGQEPEFRAFAGEHLSLLVPGHRYVLALGPARPDSCSPPGSEVKWAPIGEYSAIPVDGGVLGSGEYEGKVVTPDSFPRDALGGEKAVIATVLGKDVQSLSSLLTQTSPRAVPDPCSEQGE